MSLFSLAHAVISLSPNLATLRRYTDGGYDAQGRALPRASTTQTIVLSLQPVSGADLQKLPEGAAEAESATAHATVKLQLGDELEVQGRGRYEVVKVLLWSEHGAYWKGFVTRRDDQEPRL